MRSQTFRDYVLGLAPGEVYPIALVDVTNPALPGQNYRISSDDRNCVSQGFTYYGIQFNFVIPQKSTEVDPVFEMQIPAVTPEIIQLFDSTNVNFVFGLRIALSTSPATIELGPYQLTETLKSIDFNEQVVRIKAEFFDYLDFPRTHKRYSPRHIPALYGAS